MSQHGSHGLETLSAAEDFRQSSDSAASMTSTRKSASSMLKHIGGLRVRRKQAFQPLQPVGNFCRACVGQRNLIDCAMPMPNGKQRNRGGY